MSLVSSATLLNCREQATHAKASRIVGLCVNAPFSRVDGSAIDSVQLTRRGVSSHEKIVILSTVFGAIGGIALVLAIFLVARYYTYRQPTGGDFPLGETTKDVSNNKPEKPPARKPPVPPPPDPPFPRPRRPQTPVHTYIPNHPYALSYARPDSLPSTNLSAPPVEPASVPTVLTPPRPLPLPASAATLPSLVVPRLAHPYSQQSAAAAGVNYESFLLPDSAGPATNSMRMSSPLASSVGLTYPPSGFEWEPSSDEQPASASAFSATSSTAPLQGGTGQNQRTFR